MRTLALLLSLLPTSVFGAGSYYTFWNTNPHPWVLVSSGTNAFVTYTLVNQTNAFVIDVPTAVGQTNDVFVAAGSNITVVTNSSGGHTLYTISGAVGQTNVTLVVGGTNVVVSSTTNSGVITYTVNVPTQTDPVVVPGQSTSIRTNVGPSYAVDVTGTLTNSTTGNALTATKSSFVADISTNQIPLSGVTNAGTIAYSNATAFVLSNYGQATNTQIYGASAYKTNAWNNLNFDFSVGNYQFVSTNNAVPLSGFIGYTNGFVSWSVLSISNSAATSQTFSWPASVRLYGTNSGTSLSIPSTFVCRASMWVDLFGTNLCAICSNN